MLASVASDVIACAGRISAATVDGAWPAKRGGTHPRAAAVLRQARRRSRYVPVLNSSPVLQSNFDCWNDLRRKKVALVVEGSLIGLRHFEVKCSHRTTIRYRSVRGIKVPLNIKY